MKCRTMVEEDGVRNIVWFGSYGKNQDGTAKKANEDVPQAESNFSSGLQAMADTLTQKLSVMRGELWHSMNFGLPLLEKVKTKALIDAAVANLVLKQQNVISVLSFESSIVQKVYHCSLVVQTSLGNVTISI